MNLHAIYLIHFTNSLDSFTI